MLHFIMNLLSEQKKKYFDYVKLAYVLIFFVVVVVDIPSQITLKNNNFILFREDYFINTLCN